MLYAFDNLGKSEKNILMWKAIGSEERKKILHGSDESEHVVSHSACPSLCNPMDYSLPGSSVHRISQARILEWVAIPYSSEKEIHSNSD